MLLNRLMALLLAAAALALAALMLFHSEQAFTAALRGITIWWDVLFPALLPFLIISELMIGFGIVHFFGSLLDPVMRPLFRVPGSGGFVMAMGFASGYPVGARLTSQLWEQRLVRREEGERLVAFTTTADPIFLVGAVAVGFFHDVSLALLLGAAHYGSAVIVGLLMRYHGGRSELPSTPVLQAEKGRGMLRRALSAMHAARMKDNRPLGMLLLTAIQSSLKLMIVIGGLVVFFSVVLEMLTLANLMSFGHYLVQQGLQWANISPVLAPAVVGGLFEVTLGAQAAGQAVGDASLTGKVAVAAFILSWSGLSVHAQIVSLLSRTDLRYAPFMLAKLLHGLLAMGIVLALWTPFQKVRAASAALLPAFSPEQDSIRIVAALYPYPLLLFTATFVMLGLLFLLYKLLKAVFHPGRS